MASILAYDNRNNQVEIANNTNTVLDIPGSAGEQPGAMAGGCQGLDDLGSLLLSMPAIEENSLPPFFKGGGGGLNKYLPFLLKHFRVTTLYDDRQPEICGQVERLVLEYNNSNFFPQKVKKKKEVKYHKYCGKKSLYITYVDSKTFELKHKVIRYRCNSWRCPRCRIVLSQKHYNKLQEVITEDSEFTFLALTFDPKKVDREKAEEIEGTLWNKLMAVMRKKYGDIQYYWVREWQKNGMLHKHAIIRNDVLYTICKDVYGEDDTKREMSGREGEYYKFKSWLESYLVKIGYGEICSIERARGKEATIKYVVNKELTKSYQKRDDYIRGLRVFGCSRKFFEPKLVKKESVTLGVYIVSAEIETVKEMTDKVFDTVNQKDNFVYEIDENGKISASGSELGEFSVICPSG